jgi:hypothetical protein
MRKWLQSLVICIIFVFAGCNRAFKQEQASTADRVEKIPVLKVQLFLYSLNPHDERRFDRSLPENSDQLFHGFPILGRVEMTSVQEKEKLLTAFARGIRKSNSLEYACFDPRHGIRIISEGATNDFVICFECQQVESFGFDSTQGFLISSSPRSTFDGFLDEYKIEKAR